MVKRLSNEGIGAKPLCLRLYPSIIKTADDKFAIALLALELRQNVLNNMPGRFIESVAFAVDETEFAQYDATFPFKEKKETDSQREFRLLASLRY